MSKTPSHEKIDIGLREGLEDPVTVLSAEQAPAPVTARTTDEGLASSGSFQIIAEKYMVIKKLGAGGISSVYQVRHLHLEKVYALKLLHELKQDSIMRFHQEAKASSMLHHPNIVGIVDFGIHSGTPYMVMDCVEGLTLSQYLRANGAIEPTKLARLFGEICSALAHAHESGVVHRDIKPSNIMITLDSMNVEHAVVVDFGIAKITNQETTDSQLTRTGDVFGTPLYMSPEQCRGSAVVDARSDIYSLGCVMYEIVTGKPPFEGDSPYEIIHKQISAAPQPFSNKLRKQKTIQQLESLILRAMAKSPEDRFQYMLEMASALKAIELGSKSSQNFMPHQVKMAMARFKASDRQEGILQVGLASSAVLALALALVISTFPMQLNNTNHQIQSFNNILSTIKEIFTMRKDRSIFKIKKSVVTNQLIYLKRYCSVDPDTAAKFEITARKTLRACGTLREVARIRQEVLNASTLMEITANLNNMEANLSNTVNSWSEANQESIELTNMTSIKLDSAKNKLIIMTSLLVASLLLSLPVAVILCFLLYLSFTRQKRKNQDADTFDKVV